MIDAVTAFGIFRFTKFKPNDDENGLVVDLLFVPNFGVDAKNFGMVQVANTLLHGAPVTIGGDAVIRAHSIPAGPDAGAHIDKMVGNRNPLYALWSGPDSPATLADGETQSDFGSLGKRHRAGGVLDEAPALLLDTPHVLESGDCEQRFETACIAIAGAQAGRWYGSVVWGWRRQAGQFTRVDPKTRAQQGASPAFVEAVTIWNRSRTDTGARTIPLPLPNAE